jgi:hypothetical protein
VLRPVYAGLAAAEVALLPRWARRELKIPVLPLADAALARPAGHLVVAAIRWGISAPDALRAGPSRAAVERSRCRGLVIDLV